MKKLYFLRGAPCAGKSTLVQHLNLTKYTISLTTIQDMYSTPAVGMASNQRMITYRRNNTIASSMNLALYLTELRMQADQTIIIDAPNITTEAIQPFVKLADKYLYQPIVVNVGLQLTLQDLLKRNHKRPVIDQVTEAQIKHDLLLLRTEVLPTKCKQMSIRQFKNDLSAQSVDINQYRDVLVIGDIQSCGSALNKALRTYRSDRLYILLGDYFDRGCEPVKVMKTLMTWSKYPNVILIRGNHELHLEHFVSQMPLTGKSFQKETLPALNKAGYTRSDIRSLLARTRPFFLASFHNQELCFTHAGLTDQQLALRKRFSLQDDAFFTKGIGGYDYDLDNIFDKSKVTKLIQFHGHRNSYNYPIFRNAKQKSFNLEQKVEHGNYLGAILISYHQGKLHYIDYSIKNNNWNHEYVKFDHNSDQRFDLHVLLKSHKIQSKNIGNGLRLITVKPEYQSLGQWTEQMIQTNQIIVDTGNHLVARSYPHPIQLAYHNAQVTDILRRLQQNDLTVLTGLQSPTLIVSFSKRLKCLLVYSPDAKDEQEQQYLQNLLNNQIDLEHLTNSLAKQHCSLVFQLEKDQLSLVTAVANTYQGTLLPELAITLAKQYQLPIIKIENWSVKAHKYQERYLSRKIGQLQLTHTNNLITINSRNNNCSAIAI